MKKLFFTLALAASTILFNAATYADTFYIGTGEAVTSKWHEDGQNVTGTVSDDLKSGYADGRAGSSNKSSDPTNTRDKNWSVIYTDVFKSEYKDWMNGNPADVNRRLAAVEYILSKKVGSSVYPYVDTWKDYGATSSSGYIGSTGAKALGVVYGSTADLFSEDGIGWNAGGLSNFSTNGAGVITTYGGGYFDEAGQYVYNPDHTIDYTGKHSDLKTEAFTSVQSGIVAFTTGFDMRAGYNYINGSFSVLGELLGIYLNGTLLSSDLYDLSDNLISGGYAYTGQYNLEIDLTNSEIAALLNNGNNNLAFMVLGIPHNYTGTDSHLYNNSMSFIAFSADIVQNTNSNSSVPEPGTFLLWALGSVAAFGYYGKRRRQK
ncbi:MAG: hypothetical protein LBT05_06665 [Planctomycetaceae bacterium]|nr:hypothetical protein [Planctomycetaceae bacterium]